MFGIRSLKIEKCRSACCLLQQRNEKLAVVDLIHGYSGLVLKVVQSPLLMVVLPPLRLVYLETSSVVSAQNPIARLHSRFGEHWVNHHTAQWPIV